MESLSTAEIRLAEDYEVVREAARRELVAVKRERRIALGDGLGLVFENRETIRGMVEEVARTERPGGAEALAAEVSDFNLLLPGPRDLCATLYLEFADRALLVARAAELRGVESALAFEIDGERIPGEAAVGGVDDDPAVLSSVAFAVSRARVNWGDADEIAILVDHPACQARVTLTAPQRQALGDDL